MLVNSSQRGSLMLCQHRVPVTITKKVDSMNKEKMMVKKMEKIKIKRKNKDVFA